MLLTTTRPWLLGRHFMLRVTGLPFDALRGLRFPDSLDWADRVLREEQRLAEAGRILADELYAAVSATEDEADRRALLALRRTLFGNKAPKRVGDSLAVAERLGGAHGPQLATWLRDRQALVELTAEGARVLDAETATVRGHLREVAADPRLRQGLLLASPSLDAYLDGYRLAKKPSLDKRGRRIERSLLEYVYKVAAKTSPFSTFTGLALGEFDDNQSTVYGGEPVGADWTHFPRLNVVVLTRIADLVAADPALVADLPIALISGWKRELKRIRYVRSRVKHGDAQGSVTFDIVRNDVYFLRSSALLGRVLELLERASGWPYRDVAGLITAELGATAEETDHCLRTLLRLGLLTVPALRLDALDGDPVRGLCASLRRIGTGWAGTLAGRLDTVAEHIEAYGHASLADRRRLVDRIRNDLVAALTELGVPADEATDALPRTLLYEDSRAGAAVVTAGRSAFVEQVGDTLHELSALLPAFDYSLAHRLTLKGYFLARFGAGGRCDDLLTLVHEFHEDLYDQYLKMAGKRTVFDANGDYVDQDNWLHRPDISALDAARRAFIAGMRARSAAHPGGAEDLVLDGGFLDDVSRPLAALHREFRPWGHFVQLGRQDGDGEPLAVLNRSFGALSFPFSRFTHCFDDLGLADRLRARLADVQPPGAIFAEIIGGTLSTNLNLHGRLTDYQVVCPGDKSALPAEHQLMLADLYVEHDPADDRLVLRSRRLDREVIPLYLGYLVPTALPEVPRTLLLLSSAALAAVDVWGGVAREADEHGVVARPRVRFGNVVLARRSWAVPASALPVRGPETTDASALLDWRRWQRRTGLPDQAFVKVATRSTVDEEDGEAPVRTTRRTKPHFVDFTSAFSLRLLDGLVQDGGEAVFEEMLPTEDQLYVTSDGGQHVAEIAIEMTSESR